MCGKPVAEQAAERWSVLISLIMRNFTFVLLNKVKNVSCLH